MYRLALAFIGFTTLSVYAMEHTGFLVREFQSGTNKVCVYNVLGSEYYVNIKNTEICKLQIKIQVQK